MVARTVRSLRARNTLPTAYTSASYPPNLAYGRGRFRRGIRLQNLPGGMICAEVEDCYHAMQVAIAHDGSKVTDVHARGVRIPTTECAGATVALRSLIGMPINIEQQRLYAEGNPRQHCTHLFDLAALALAHACRPLGERRYDICVPDDAPGGVHCTIHMNGLTVIHDWLVENEVILQPTQIAGRAVLNGFIPWAYATFSGDQLEAALVLQKGFFVSRARRNDYSRIVGRSIGVNRHMHGRCFAYQPHRAAIARHLDTTRDFTDAPQDVLTFAAPHCAQFRHRRI